MPADSRPWALIAAGGTGTRLGGGLPKQLLPLAGRPVIVHAVERLLAPGGADRVIIAMHPEWIEPCRGAMPEGLRDRLEIVPGGETRQESVLRGLEAAHAAGCGAIMVHDAARPLLSAALVGRIVAAFDGARGVVPVVPVPDSVILLRPGGEIERYLDRSLLALVQTPQLFPCSSLIAAHRAALGAGRQGTDDASIFLSAGGGVVTVEGDPANLKITWPSDLAMAEALLERERV